MPTEMNAGTLSASRARHEQDTEPLFLFLFRSSSGNGWRLAAVGSWWRSQRKNFLRGKEKMIKRAGKLEADLRHTNSLLASDPTPTPQYGGGGDFAH